MRFSKFYILLASLVMIFSFMSCSPGPYEDANEMVSDAKTRIKEVSVQDFGSMMDKGVDFKLIDCREPDEFKAGRIPGAINIPRGLLEFKIAKEVPDKGTKIYMYCKVGGRGALATESLMNLKYTDVVNIDGGWEAWVKAYPNKIKK